MGGHRLCTGAARRCRRPRGERSPRRLSPQETRLQRENAEREAATGEMHRGGRRQAASLGRTARSIWTRWTRWRWHVGGGPRRPEVHTGRPGGGNDRQAPGASAQGRRRSSPSALCAERERDNVCRHPGPGRPRAHSGRRKGRRDGRSTGSLNLSSVLGAKHRTPSGTTPHIMYKWDCCSQQAALSVLRRRLVGKLVLLLHDVIVVLKVLRVPELQAQEKCAQRRPNRDQNSSRRRARSLWRSMGKRPRG